MQLNRHYLTNHWPVCSSLIILLFFVVQAASAQDHSHTIAGKCVVNRIDLSGNSITKPFIIYRELVFARGDTISVEGLPAMLEQSRQNLLNTALFNFVTIDTHRNQLSLAEIDIRINVIERWYVWPSPILEITDRNFNIWWASRDFTRINYGFSTIWSNFRGRMESLDLMLRFGKNHEYSLLYDIPYLDKKKHFGAGIEAGTIRNREVGFITQQDKLVFLFDKEYLVKQQFTAVHISYRPRIHTTHLADFRLQSIRFSDSLQRSNPGYSYENNSELRFMSLYYKIKVDFRDAKYYPLSGWYTDLEVYKAGLGFQFEGPVNVLWVKSTSRVYIPIAKRFYFGGGFIAKVSSPFYQPYFLEQGLGYDRDYVRGYEYYVIDGEHYLLARTTVKYALIPEFAANIGFIPTPKFSRIHFASYITLFSDAGYVWNKHGYNPALNKLPESILLGAGLGMDLVTYYDKVMRIEYTLNKKSESGIFIHFIAGI